MKKLLSVFLVLVITISMIPVCVPVHAVGTTSDGFEYDIANGEAVITKYIGSAADIVIPSEIDGYPVTRIGFQAFSWLSRIESVVIPEGVYAIEDRVFTMCSKIKSISLPQSLTSIGSEAFSSCSSLESISIPNGVKIIENSTFNGCSSLKNVSLPVSIESLGDQAFYSCYALESINIPKNVTSIGEMAFNGIKTASAITIDPENTSYYFSGNCLIESSTGTIIKGFSDSVIPDDNSIKAIGNSAFSSLRSLTEIRIPEGVVSIGESAFSSCSALESIKLPQSLRSIGRDAFKDTAYYKNDANWQGNILYIDSFLIVAKTDISTSVTVQSGTVAIADLAFLNCASITGITIPSSVLKIGKGIISGCTSITSVRVNSGNPTYHSSNNCIIETVGKALVAGCKSSTIPSDGSVTSIGDYAFYHCRSLTSISIPKSVSSIGKYAFTGCDGLTSISLHNRITSIGEQAFAYCDGITSIYIPESVITIGDSAFFYCSYLNSIDISYGVETIGANAFAYCGNQSRVSMNIVIPDSVTTMGEAAFCGLSYLNSIVISENLSEIPPHAIYNSINLQSVTIPEGVTKIGNNAFFGCSVLSYLSIPASMKSIEYNAFYNCQSLYYVYYGASEARWEDMFISSNNAPIDYADIIFEKDSDPNGFEYEIYNGEAVITGYFGKNTEVVVPDTISGYPVTAIADNAFYDRKAITSVTLPQGIESIGAFAFYNCVSLVTANIPEGLAAIGEYAFFGCTGLETVYYGGAKSDWDYFISIGENNDCLLDADLICAIYEPPVPEGLVYTVTDGEVTITDYTGSEEEIVIPDKIARCPVTAIESEAFRSCKSLKRIGLPEALRRIAPKAFTYCSSLESIAIPKSVTSIGSEAFYGCTSLDTVYIEDIGAWCNISFTGFYSTPMHYATELYLNGSPVTDLVIPDGVTAIKDMAFYSWEGLESISIPSSVNHISTFGAFTDCIDLESITVSRGNTSYYSSGNCIISNSGELIAGCFNSVIPEGVTTIEENAFRGCTQLYEIDIPEGVTAIKDYAFSSCNGLVSITLPESLTSLGGNAFSYCSSLETVNIPGSLEAISEYAFFDCPKLVNVNFAEGVKKIGDYAFMSCDGLKAITLPEGFVSIGKNAFDNCKNLESVTIPASVTTISQYAFNRCSKLSTVYYSGSEAMWSHISIGSSNTPLINAEKIFGKEDLPVPEGLEYSIVDKKVTITKYTGNTSEIVIPDMIEGYPVVEIESNAFENCTTLVSVEIPETVSEIGSCAFLGCSSIKSMTLPDSVTEIQYNTFTGCSSLEEIELPESLERISWLAFSNCSSLENIVIPENVNIIDFGAFQNCSSLRNIIIMNGDSPLQIQNSAFYGCDNIEGAFYTGDYMAWGELVEVGSDNGYLSKWYPEGNISGVYGDFVYQKILYGSEISIVRYIGDDPNPTVPRKIENIPVTLISGSSFAHTPVESVDLPSSVTDISYYAFDGCTNLRKIDIPSSVKSIYFNAFADCSSLETVTIPSGVTSIMFETFSGCTSLKTVYITDSVTSIGDSAFKNCVNLETVYFTGEEEQWDAIDMGNGNSCLTNANIVFVPKPEYTPGDIDGDGKLTAMDSNLLKRIVAGTMPAEGIPAADVNGDGAVNAIDSNILRRTVAGQ